MLKINFTNLIMEENSISFNISLELHEQIHNDVATLYDIYCVAFNWSKFLKQGKLSYLCKIFTLGTCRPDLF